MTIGLWTEITKLYDDRELHNLRHSHILLKVSVHDVFLESVPILSCSYNFKNFWVFTQKLYREFLCLYFYTAPFLCVAVSPDMLKGVLPTGLCVWLFSWYWFLALEILLTIVSFDTHFQVHLSGLQTSSVNSKVREFQQIEVARRKIHMILSRWLSPTLISFCICLDIFLKPLSSLTLHWSKQLHHGRLFFAWRWITIHAIAKLVESPKEIVQYGKTQIKQSRQHNDHHRLLNWSVHHCAEHAPKMM